MHFLIILATLIAYGSSMPQGETRPSPGIPGGPESGSPGNGGHGAPLPPTQPQPQPGPGAAASPEGPRPPPGIPGGPEPGSPGNGGHGAPLPPPPGAAASPEGPRPPPGIPGGPEPGSPGNGGHGAPLESPTKPGAGDNGGLICVCRPVPGGAGDSYSCKCNPTVAGAVNPGTPIGTGGENVNVQVPPGNPPPRPLTDPIPPQPGGNPPTNPAPGGTPQQDGNNANPANPNPNPAAQPGGGNNQPQPGTSGNNPAAQAAGGNTAGTGNTAASQSSGAAGTTDTSFGDTWSYVMCTKRSNSRKPDWGWLLDKNGKSIKVNGKWLSYKCTYGTVTPMYIQTNVYNDINSQCQANGYELAQPADSIHSDWYPFQIDQTLTEYFRLNYVFGFATSYDRRLQSPIDKC